MPRKPADDEEIIRDLVAYADTREELGLSAYKLVQLYLDIDHLLAGRNPRKLLDSMDRLSDMGNE